METSLLAAFVMEIYHGNGIAFFAATIVVLVVCVALFVFWLRQIRRPIALVREAENPILKPIREHWWESEAVFNPAAFYFDGRVHLLYRAMGKDGISRIGYASSADGIHFDRLPYPVYAPDRSFGAPKGRLSYGTLTYDTVTYPSGGGWGGVEDPRIVSMNGQLYMTFVAFDGWGFIRMGLTSLPLPKFRQQSWEWKPTAFLSPPGEINKNWVMFPERIHGKYAVLHSISPTIQIEYVDSLSQFNNEAYIHSVYHPTAREEYWDSWVRGAGPPPIKTPKGWLLLYHAMDKRDPNKYKIGAMLLDLDDPTRVLYRSNHPVLEPEKQYENDWKPGVVYACGAVVMGNTLFVYYGAGDKHVAVAHADIREFVEKLMTNQQAVLRPAGA